MFQGIPSMMVSRGTPVSGGGGITWTERATANFFECTGGQGHSGQDIASVYPGVWVGIGANAFACNGGANGGATSASNGHILYYNDSYAFLATQYSQVTFQAVPDINTQGGVSVRVQSGGTENAYYLAYNIGNGNLELGKNNAGTLAVLNSTAKTYSNGAIIRLEVTGTGSASRLTAYENTGSGLSVVFSSIDPGGTYIDGGKPGLWALPVSGGVTFDDWSGGDGA